MTVARNLPSVGCIGCGNMGGAIMAGLSARHGRNLYGYNRTPERLRRLEPQVRPVADMAELASLADIVIIAVKPHLVRGVLDAILPALTSKKLVVSVAAGITQAVLRAGVDGICPVVRAMPNTPALAGRGVTALCFEDPALREEQKQQLHELFGCVGMTLELPESRFAAFSAFIGCGPGYVFHCMNAVMQAGVTLGFPRAEARRMTEMLFEGCACMAGQSEASLSDLRDQVCSPGGMTIAGVNHMERTGVAGHIIDAVLAADARGRDMEK
ncbi:MAG: pyrroline-5-carboxylate reductase [Desulfovibrionaceae bacterium]|nr:pyrroline-5-carboxylate reductase [Desulfovibrionaceae bacterium]